MAVTVECVWCPCVWPWQFDVIVTYPRGWRCQLDVVCARVCVTHVRTKHIQLSSLWQLDVVGAHLYRDDS